MFDVRLQFSNSDQTKVFMFHEVRTNMDKVIGFQGCSYQYFIVYSGFTTHVHPGRGSSLFLLRVSVCLFITNLLVLKLLCHTSQLPFLDIYQISHSHFYGGRKKLEFTTSCTVCFGRKLRSDQANIKLITFIPRGKEGCMLIYSMERNQGQIRLV